MSSPARSVAISTVASRVDAVRLLRTLRVHACFVGLLAVGLVLRVLVMAAYPQAFWYTDSSRYLLFSYGWQPDFVRQAGYSLFLKVVRQTGSLYTVSAVQHLLGLAMAVAVYAFLQRRSVPWWLSLLAVAPLLLDGFELTVEHYVLAETTFTSLIVAGLLALVWPERLTAMWAGLAGFLLAASATFRVVSLPLVALTAAYLVIRRAGWRPVVAFALCAAAPLAAYVTWFHQTYGRYGLSTMQGAFLYGRVAPVAVCEELDLTPAQRAICPTQPVGVRPVRSDWYIFSPDSPASNSDLDTRAGFAMAVFTQQPGSVSWAIAKDVAKYLLPGHMEPDWVCTTEGELLPAEPPSGRDYAWCKPNPRQAFSARADPATMPGSTPLTRALGAYAHAVQTPSLVLGASVLLIVVVVVWHPRRRIRGTRVSDPLVFGMWGLGLIAFGVTGSMFDERYGVPSLTMLPAAGALALHRLWLMRDSGADAGSAGTEHRQPD